MNALSVLTISQLNMYVKSLLDGDSSLNRVFVSGEISNFTNHYRSGHLYLSLKDEKCVIKAVMFSSYASRLRFEPKDGMKVLVRGRVSLYEQSGQYQLYIEDMQPDGLGALNLAYEQLKEKLAAEGLFDTNKKQPLRILHRNDCFYTAKAHFLIFPISCIHFGKIISRNVALLSCHSSSGSISSIRFATSGGVNTSSLDRFAKQVRTSGLYILL